MPLLTCIDQMGEEVSFPFPPRRIISLVPSQTELLSDLNLSDSVVGITKFCVHPEAWLKSKTVIGGTKHFDFDTIDSLSPDLIIGNKEENYQDGIITLKRKYPVWMSDIVTLEDALAMIEAIGKLTARHLESTNIMKLIHQAFADLAKFQGQSVLYLIWRKPWMAAGPSTFIDAMIRKLGLKNVITDPRYPELTNPSMAALNPDYVFLSSEPYPFQDKHRNEIQQLLPHSKILLVDGEMFSWHGSRLIKFPEYAKTIVNTV